MTKRPTRKKSYKPTVFRIETWNDDGTPDNCTIIRDDRTVHLSKDVDMNHFMVCLVPEVMLKPKKRKKDEP